MARVRPLTDIALASDTALINQIHTSGKMLPLQCMQDNMESFMNMARVYEARVMEAKPATRENYRLVRHRREQQDYIDHCQTMATKYRVLAQNASESLGNYVHAKIQSVTVGNASGNRPITVVLKGPDAQV